MFVSRARFGFMSFYAFRFKPVQNCRNWSCCHQFVSALLFVLFAVDAFASAAFSEFAAVCLIFPQSLVYCVLACER